MKYDLKKTWNLKKNRMEYHLHRNTSKKTLVRKKREQKRKIAGKKMLDVLHYGLKKSLYIF